MKKSPVGHNGDQDKVVSLRLDARFYYERAVQSLERHRYDRALKYFRFSIDKEPDNPVNHCNLAGLLAELGRFEESNQVLEQVLDHIAPDFHECLFYIANNYAYMGQFERAEDYLLEYMEREPYGEYVEEAEEMLQLLSMELGRPPKEISQPLPAYIKEHEDARRRLEEGDFLQAAEQLEKLVESYPDFHPAYNNLALAYYYIGHLEKAFQLTKHVFETEPSNIHAWCNLALFAQDLGDTERSQSLTRRLKKIVPLNPDHLYKLASTMGMLGEHEIAYQLFYRLLHLGIRPSARLYHCLAVAACHLGRINQARRYWKQAAQLDKDSNVPRFYLDQLDDRLRDQLPNLSTIQYYFHMPYEEKLFQLQVRKQLKMKNGEIEADSLLKASFLWSLKHADHAAKVRVIQLLGIIANAEAEQMLRSFLLYHSSHDDECKKFALLMLRQMHAEPPYSLWLNNQLVVIEVPDGRKTEPFINPVWGQILTRCLEGMRDSPTQLREDVKTLLFEFLNQGSPLPNVRRVEAWAAALEYIVAKHHGLSLTQTEVARKYQISTSTVAYYVKRLRPFKGVFTKS